MTTATMTGVPFIISFQPNGQLTDRRRNRALAANPASKEPGAPEQKHGAAVRVHPIVI
jgi:hypothetical protein